MEITIPARDGYELGASVHEPNGRADRTVILSSGVGFVKEFYEDFASFLSKEGYRVVLYDYRGTGESAPNGIEGFDSTLTEWGTLDLNGVYDWVRDQYPDDDLVAFGHSIGCLLIGMSDHVEALDASVFVTPPHAYWGNWPGTHKLWMIAVMYGVIPGATHLAGYFPGRTLGFGEDLPRGVALEWAKWCRSRDYLFDHLDEQQLKGYDKFRVPTLVWSFEDDLYAPPESVRAALNHYPNTPMSHREVAPWEVEADSIGHLGFFREQFVDTLWRDTAGWMNQRM